MGRQAASVEIRAPKRFGEALARLLRHSRVPTLGDHAEALSLRDAAKELELSPTSLVAIIHGRRTRLTVRVADGLVAFAKGRVARMLQLRTIRPATGDRVIAMPPYVQRAMYAAEQASTRSRQAMREAARYTPPLERDVVELEEALAAAERREDEALRSVLRWKASVHDAASGAHAVADFLEAAQTSLRWPTTRGREQAKRRR